MDNAPVELWLPAAGDALPECLLGVPLLSLPVGDSFFKLVTSSVWTPLTWGDSVRAVPPPDGGYSVRALAAAGPHVRAVVTYEPTVAAMSARTVAQAWGERGAVAIETAPGLFVTAWSPELDGAAVRDALAASIGADDRWSVLEVWEPHERTPEAIAAHFPTQ
ncbi:hypothetical protein BJY21_002005 [Kineosphaera limosa]|uniref:DUF4265 domain-containing protein n=1 Tax=Kineosphaera limosa NBRC 100340 TaxID=1184609 RepID=K6WGF3_9MICO|nr:hypothetical protein [Kineosphaera limosa]NYE00821.1 hypothetical protein [Kineosphaera limosa]GAB98355.1 hypothetical protein KILIM_134_00040 [Kineosphaera limosa NBRC 100340]